MFWYYFPETVIWHVVIWLGAGIVWASLVLAGNKVKNWLWPQRIVPLNNREWIIIPWLMFGGAIIARAIGQHLQKLFMNIADARLYNITDFGDMAAWPMLSNPMNSGEMWGLFVQNLLYNLTYNMLAIIGLVIMYLACLWTVNMVWKTIQYAVYWITGTLTAEHLSWQKFRQWGKWWKGFAYGTSMGAIMIAIGSFWASNDGFYYTGFYQKDRPRLLVNAQTEQRTQVKMVNQSNQPITLAIYADPSSKKVFTSLAPGEGKIIDYFKASYPYMDVGVEIQTGTQTKTYVWRLWQMPVWANTFVVALNQLVWNGTTAYALPTQPETDIYIYDGPEESYH